jgi:hypothetical protein
MKVLTHYTPAVPQNGPPAPEHMAKMGAFMDASIKSGVLIATGGIMPSATNGMQFKLADGAFDVQAARPANAPQAGGWAILNVDSTEHLTQVARQFLEVAGDGEVKVMEISQFPIP